MSQMRVFVQEFRAALSAATICALILGLIFSNVAQASGGRLSHVAHAKAGAYSSCIQHLANHASAEKPVAPTSGDERNDKQKCPACCLAVSLGAALLPERVTNITRPASDRPFLVAYAAASVGEPKTFLSHAANGARAPPF